MSASEYNTIRRTPLNQLHNVPVEALSAYLAHCNAITRRAVERITSASASAS